MKVFTILLAGLAILTCSPMVLAKALSVTNHISITVINKTDKPMQLLLAENHSAMIMQGQPRNEGQQAVLDANGGLQKILFDVNGLAKAWEVLLRVCQDSNDENNADDPLVDIYSMVPMNHVYRCAHGQEYICRFHASGNGTFGVFTTGDRSGYVCRTSTHLGDDVTFTIGQ